MNQHFVICIDNEEYPASLERRKLYEVIPDPDAESLGQIRVRDESGDDYLYPNVLFVTIDLPSSTEKAVISAALQIARVRSGPGGPTPDGFSAALQNRRLAQTFGAVD